MAMYRQSLLKFATHLSSLKCTYNSNYNILRCCRYSAEANDPSKKYGYVIDYLRLTRRTDGDKIRKTNFGSVRLDIDNPDEFNIENEYPINEEDANLGDAFTSTTIRHSDLATCQNSSETDEPYFNDDNITMENSAELFSEETDSSSYENVCSHEETQNKTTINIIREFTSDVVDCSIKRNIYSFEDGIKDNCPNVDDYLNYRRDSSSTNVQTKNRKIRNARQSKTIHRDNFETINLDEGKIPPCERFENDILDETVREFRTSLEKRIKLKNVIQEQKERKLVKEAQKYIEEQKDEEESKNEPETAIDAVKAMRSQGSCTKKYQKILNDIPNFYLCTRYDIVQMLLHSVVFKNENLVGISKPYGMEMHGGASGRLKKPNILHYLPDLAAKLNCDALYPVHRLDATTTGVLLLAKTPEYATRLKAKFKKGELEKTYVAITKGIPEPDKGVIKIFIGERRIENRIRMDVKPDLPGFKVRHGFDKKAITKFEVISSTKSVAVVEVKPLTGVKHQIRVHLGMALKCPILGDHKYSNATTFAPQRLDSDTLRRMDVKQSRVRDLPMFLHSSSILIPDVDECNSVRVSAKIPNFFLTCIKMLNLNKSKNRVSNRALEFIKEVDYSS